MGEIRYFSDRFGRARGSIEGTQLPYDLIAEHAGRGEVEVVYEPERRRVPLQVRRVRSYQGFELDADAAPLQEFDAEVAAKAREVLAEAMASGEAHHRDTRSNRGRMRTLREVYRRSGGSVTEPSEAAFARYFRERLKDVDSFAEFMETDLAIDLDAWASPEERKRWMELPDTVELAGEQVPLDYTIDDGVAIVRARITEKLLHRLTASAVPTLDRPLHWTVLRGKHEAVRAATLDEARELAARPRTALRQEGRMVREGEERERGRRPRGGDRNPKGKRGGGRGGRRGGPPRRGRR